MCTSCNEVRKESSNCRRCNVAHIQRASRTESNTVVSNMNRLINFSVLTSNYFGMPTVIRYCTKNVVQQIETTHSSWSGSCVWTYISFNTYESVCLNAEGFLNISSYHITRQEIGYNMEDNGVKTWVLQKDDCFTNDR